MSIRDRATILRFHKDRIAEFGEDSPLALGWKSEESQIQSFESLISIADLSGEDILDVGCGHGDLFPYLSEHFQHFHYTGLDHMPTILEVASKRYSHHPNVQFLLGDFWAAPLTPASYILACGALSYRNEDPLFLEKMIQKLFDASGKALGFTLLRKVDITESLLVTHEIGKVLSFCEKICHQLSLNATEEGFTVFMYKDR